MVKANDIKVKADWLGDYKVSVIGGRKSVYIKKRIVCRGMYDECLGWNVSFNRKVKYIRSLSRAKAYASALLKIQGK